jgi:hypothetical protein
MRKVKRARFEGPTKSARQRERQRIAQHEHAALVLNDLIVARQRRDVEDGEIERLVVKARVAGIGWPRIAVALNIDPSTAWRRWGRGDGVRK